MMPDDRGRAECDDVAFLLQAPAEIDVVARLAIFDIEAADGVERPAIEGHVTARNVLRHGVGQEHVARAAGRRRDAGLDPIFRRRRNVRAADPGIIAAHERADQIIEPVGIRHAVGVGVGEHFAPGRGRAGVARVTQAVVLLPDVTDLRKTRGDLRRVVGRAVIDQDGFVGRIVDLA